MKKLLSVVLVLAMLASMCVYLPMGVTAAETRATTIYAEDFTDMDGTYTLGELADVLGWNLLRGEETAEATISGGALTIDTTALDTDVVFEMATSTALKANHTYQYDMVMGSYGNELHSSFIYTGTDNGNTAKFIAGKTTYQGYNHMAMADGVINEATYSGSGYKINGGSYDQCRPENIPGGATTNTWKTVVDVTNNQVDVYASGARINSTANEDFTKGNINIASYVGEGAYLRVATKCVATFDNISIVSGGDAIVNAKTGVIFNQDFSGIADGTYTGAQAAALIGFQTFKDSTANAEMVYKIQNGRLEILANGECTNSYTFSDNPQFGTLYLPEAQDASDLVIEYDMTYLYDANAEGSANSGDAPLGMAMYGRRSDFTAFWQFSQKGFPQYGFTKGTVSLGQTQARYEDTYFNATYAANSVTFSNGTYHHSLYNSTESIKVVLSVTDGFMIYVNDVLAVQLTQANYEKWASNQGGASAGDIIGNLLRFHIPAGCHVALDNFKVTKNPAKLAGPDLWLTEASCGDAAVGGFGGAEYVEVYNASNNAINIYDYALTQRSYSNSLDNIGATIGTNNVHFAYPGAHTYNSVNTPSPWSYTITNPAYEEGWIQPGEVCMLWNKTDSMHNGAGSTASVVTTVGAANYGMGNHGHRTITDFRNGLNLPENVKVFQVYNDNNRAFNNSGSHFVALVARSLVQPGYDPATGTGSETVNNAKIYFSDYKSTILDVTADTNSGRTVKTVPYANYDVTEGMGYSSVVFGRPIAAVDATKMTPGTLTDSQRKAANITVDGSVKATYLGAAYSYAYTSTETDAPNFYKDLFAVVDGEIVMADDPAYGTVTVTGNNVIQRYKLAMTSVPGVGVRFGGTRGGEAAAGLRWITGVKTSHIDELMDSGLVAGVEIGTLMTKEGDLSIDNVTADNGADGKTNRKIAAYQGYWFDETANASYADMVFFAGGVGQMMVENYAVDYKGIGYATITMNNGDTITVYGDTESANNVVDIATEALADPDNGLTSDEVDLLNLYLEQIEPA